MAPFSVALFVSFMSLVPRLSNHSDAVASATVCLLHFADKMLSHWCLIFYPLTGYSINKEKGRRLSPPIARRKFMIFPINLAGRNDFVINCEDRLSDAAW